MRRLPVRGVLEKADNSVTTFIGPCIDAPWSSSMTDPFSKPLRPKEIGMRGEICGKWSKITAQEVRALRSNDDLVSHVQAKYELGRPEAQSEVDAFAKGRRL